jgi:hypothetical protein
MDNRVTDMLDINFRGGGNKAHCIRPRGIEKGGQNAVKKSGGAVCGDLVIWSGKKEKRSGL